MKVLILFQFDNHEQLINKLCKNLNAHNINSDSFNIVSLKFTGYNNYRGPLYLKIIKPLIKISIIQTFLIVIFRKKIILSISNNYDIIDIHFFDPAYENLIDPIKRKGKKIIITLWGSDFYRVNQARFEQQREYYQKVDTIHIATQQMQNDFIKIFPEFKDKIRLAHFGIAQFDIINELTSISDNETLKKELEIPSGKIIIACGTNGSEHHQHLLIIENILKLSTFCKNKIFLIFPMTYGGSTSYIKAVERKAESSGIPYKVISSPWSINDICKLRIVSDIAITIQKTDSFSAAVQEHIFSGSIMICGEWLPYQKLFQSGIFYLSTSLESLVDTISDAINNFSMLKNKCLTNKSKMSEISSWNSVIRDWLCIYNELGN